MRRLRKSDRGWPRDRRDRRLTYANVTATLALFVALGGTSYAVTKLPRNSVGSNQVRDGSLLRKDLATGVVPAAIRGPRGSQGPAGPAGPAGVQGGRGPSNVLIAPASSSVTLSGLAGQQSEVRRMDNVPAGAWLVRFDANAGLFIPDGMYATCVMKVNGDGKATADAVVGQNANATQEVGIATETAVQQTAPFNVTVDCSQDKDSSPAMVIIRPQIVATQVADVTTTP